jgi:5-formyltetrahydrofolate cyclo-ligase
MNVIKQNLRHSARDHRNKITPHPDYADHAARMFCENFDDVSNKNIALYMTNGSELDTFPLAELLWEHKINILLPVIHADSKILSFHAWNKNTELRNNKFEILEPIDKVEIIPDILIVPLLAFDQKGTRLGMGGGYYDATVLDLKSKGHKLITVGYAYTEQAVLLALPREDHDQSLDFVITPQRVFDFRLNKV